ERQLVILGDAVTRLLHEAQGSARLRMLASYAHPSEEIYRFRHILFHASAIDERIGEEKAGLVLKARAPARQRVHADRVDLSSERDAILQFVSDWARRVPPEFARARE